MNLLRTAAAAVAAATIVAVAPASSAGPRAASPPSGGSFTHGVYPAAGAPGAREYWLFVPSKLPRGRHPVVVFLHGCNETAVQAAQATRFNQLAAKRGFVVVYPQQLNSAPQSAPVADGNGIGCWNWFLPDDQQRGAGEPATIAGLTRDVVRRLNGDPRRVYVEGISAGADMAVILGATYPDLYAAVGVLAGCSYRTCGDGSGKLTVGAMGQYARTVPMFVENGTADALNNIGMANGLVESWLGADDLVDNGQLDNSVPRQPSSTMTYGTDQTPAPGSGDLCVHNDSFTCVGGAVGFQGTYPYTVLKFADARGCDVLDYWVIHGMEHAHPDAPGDGPYTDPLGPDITTASYNFFSAHPMTGSCSR